MSETNKTKYEYHPPQAFYHPNKDKTLFYQPKEDKDKIIEELKEELEFSLINLNSLRDHTDRYRRMLNDVNGLYLSECNRCKELWYINDFKQNSKRYRDCDCELCGICVKEVGSDHGC